VHGEEKGKTTVFTPLPAPEDLLRLASQPTAADVRSSLKPKLVAASWENSYIVYTSSLISGPDEQRGDDVLLVLGRENDFGQTGLGKGRVDASGVGLISLEGALPQDEQDAGERGRGRGRVEIVHLVGSVRHVILIASWLSSVGTSREADSQRRRRYALIGWGAGRQCQLGSLDTPDSTRDRGRGVGATAGNIVWTPRLIRLWYSEQLEIDTQASLSLGRDHTALLVPAHWGSEDASSSSSVPGKSGEKQSENRLLLLGSNKYGQLDIGTCMSDVVSVACTWNSTLVALNDGSLLASGRNDKGQLGGEAQQHQPAKNASIAPAQIAPVPAVDTRSDGQVRKQTLVCGSEHALLLLHDPSSEGASQGGESSVWGWGWNEHGNLALGGQPTSDVGQQEEARGQEEEEAVEDQRTPVRLWPAPVALTGAGRSAQEVHEVAMDIWAGCATSFVQVLRTQK
jgi:hypothetical protein